MRWHPNFLCYQNPLFYHLFLFFQNPKTLLLSPNLKNPLSILSLSVLNTLIDPSVPPLFASSALPLNPHIPHFASDQPRKGADVLVEALERAFVDVVFTCRTPPSSLEIHEVLDESKNSYAIVTSGIGEHQMFAAQWYNLPGAIGAAKASPASTVVGIEGYGSLIRNVQELVTVLKEQLDIKIMVLNNQHLDPGACFYGI